MISSRILLVSGLLALGACKHPLEIIGEGDITSASGERGCSLEEFQAGATNCTENEVAEAYNETYIATPREGYAFDRWFNGCNTSVSNECSFNVAADVVEDFAGETAAPLKAKFRKNTTGFESLFIGHSFFRPFAESMEDHAARAGFPDHSQSLVFAGGANGAPEALWDDTTKRAEIQAILDDGDIELFGMTYHPDYPTLRGYQLWINYALAQKSDTKFFIAFPWLFNPEDYEADAYLSDWKAEYIDVVHSFLDLARQTYPDVEFYGIPYGQIGGELYVRYENGELDNDVLSLVGTSETGVFRDDFGHAGDIMVALGEFVWLYSIYGVHPTTYDYDPGYTIDLKEIAQRIIGEHDPYYDAD